MNKILIVALLAASAAACNNARPVAVNTTVPATSNDRGTQTAIAHNTDASTPPAAPSANGATSHWKQSGEPIETKELDAGIAAAEVAFKKSPGDKAVEKKLADAYYARASALTEARQYASALGDYRRALKHDPSNAEAKDWIEKIISIYDSMGREYPKEGEEPPALSKTKS